MSVAVEAVDEPVRDDSLSPVTTARRRGLLRRLRPFVPHLVLSVGAIPMLIPFYWMVISSLKTPAEILVRPVVWWPTQVLWQNYVQALTFPGFPFLLFLYNSVFFATSVTVGSVISCAAVAYGFARLRFPGRSLLFAITISTLMIPPIVIFIPTYVLFKYLGLLGGYAPLILPAFFGNAFFIFMLRQFYMGLPWELTESARVDGASEFRIFWQIMLPLVKSALMVVAVFTFLWTWNDFFGPLIYLMDSNLYPLSLGLSVFRERYVTRWDLIMAASTITTFPMIVVFFLTQRHFMQGIAMTGIKG